MATSAFQTMYRQEIIQGFDQNVSLLRDCVTTEFVNKGGSAVFLVSDGSAVNATTRGLNGLIPARNLSLTQNTATLAEWNDLVTVSNFNIFASQGDLKKPMQREVMTTINRKIDADIIAQLDTATNDTGAAVAGSVELVGKAKVILGVNKIPNDGNLVLLGTPALIEYMKRSPAFSSADYVNMRPYADGGKPAFADQPMVYMWNGMKVIEHPGLTGIGTSSEKCYLFHKSAIGHAIDKNTIDATVGYNEEQNYTYSRATAYMASKLLQNAGVVQILHDGSAFAAS
jgi:hypothetical protein